MSHSCDNSCAEDAVDSADVGADAGDVKMMPRKGHRHLHLLENYYYL